MVIGNIKGVQAQETTWEYDETDHLTQETLNHITDLNERVFSEYELHPQLGIEILYDLPEEYADIDEYRNERFNELGVGSSGEDTGILYIMVINDRAFAIETGYGVEHVITDLEAQQILDRTIDDMRMYSDTQEPEYINNTVMSVANDVSRLSEMANTGELFEIREEEERQAEIERQKNADKMRTSLIGFVSIVGVGTFSAFGIKALKERKRKKKQEQLEKEINNALPMFMELYGNGEVPFSEEMPYEMFEEGYRTRYKESEEGDIEDSLDNKMITLNKIRVDKFKNIVENMSGLKYLHAYYVEHADVFKEKMSDQPEITVKEFVDEMDEKFDRETSKRDIEVRKIESELDSYLDETDLPEGVEEDAIRVEVLNGITNEFNLNNSDVMRLSIREIENKRRKERMEYWFRYMLIRQVIQNKDEFRDKTYHHGSRSEFTEFAQKELAQSDTPTSKLVDNEVITTALMGLAVTYLTRKEREYEEEQRRIARQRAEEERRRRQQRNNSSSGGGSFGGGFGGGSSGGGGASGGW